MGMVGSDIVGTEEGCEELGLGNGDGVIDGGVFMGNELQLSLRLPTPLPLALLFRLLLEFWCEDEEKFPCCWYINDPPPVCLTLEECLHKYYKTSNQLRIVKLYVVKNV